jgi:hypothetical protein
MAMDEPEWTFVETGDEVSSPNPSIHVSSDDTAIKVWGMGAYHVSV